MYTCYLPSLIQIPFSVLVSIIYTDWLTPKMKSINGLAVSSSDELFNIIYVFLLVSTKRFGGLCFLSNRLYHEQVKLKLSSQEND